MTFQWDASSGRVQFVSLRRGTSGDLASRFVYAPSGETETPSPSSLEFFLVERYVLFAESADRRLWSGVVHHSPYEVTKAQVDDWDDSLFPLNDLPRPDRPPDHALMCRGVDVEVFALQPVNR